MTGRVKVTLACDATLIQKAKDAGINLSKLLDEAIVYALGVRQYKT